MRDSIATDTGSADFRTIKRFLPYLWPAGQARLKARVFVAMLLVIAAKTTQLTVMPFALGGAVDHMTKGQSDGLTIARQMGLLEP